MPYVLSGIIRTDLPGLWGEGAPYTPHTIYDINANDPQLPPVNYGAHVLKPHSIPHIDAPGHIIPGGKTVDAFFTPEARNAFFGKVTVIKLQGSKWKDVEGMKGMHLWEITPQEIDEALQRVQGSIEIPEKLFITAEFAPATEHGYHDPNYVLVLKEETARILVEKESFNAYGTSWKSSDFQPGSRERPIHTILFQRAILFEHLKLDHVPEGVYFLSGFPLPLQGATESPCAPVLFERDELRAFLA